jgi:Putative MetA-pathway of phenol degradation
VTALVAAVLLLSAKAVAQELEPGAYSVAPVGLNVVVVADTLSFGDVAFDPAGPIDDARATLNFTTLAYARTFALAGRSANVSIGVPFAAGHLQGRYLGEFAEVTRFGPGDPRARLGINFYGAPAMDPRTFAANRPSRLVGASVTVSLPLGQYSADRLINIGSNRWAFKPEIGVSREAGRWTIEGYGGVWFFTKNSELYGNRVRTQQPLGSLQFHLQYAVSPRLLLSANSNFYFGGRTTVNGRSNLDLQRNSRVGVTVSRPMSRGRTLRVAASRGAYTTVGADFTSISAAFQWLWGS